jgi:ferrous iron transport protein A
VIRRRHRLRELHFHHQPSLDLAGEEVPLNALRPGEKGVVIGIVGGRGMLARMTSLGFVPGTQVVLLQNYRHGPIIVQAHDARIALGRGIAGRIRMRRSET